MTAILSLRSPMLCGTLSCHRLSLRALLTLLALVGEYRVKGDCRICVWSSGGALDLLDDDRTIISLCSFGRSFGFLEDLFNTESTLLHWLSRLLRASRMLTRFALRRYPFPICDVSHAR